MVDERLASRLDALRVQRVALIKPSALGDVVQTLPLLPALRRRFPTAELTWVVQRELSDLVVGHPDLDRVILSDRRPTWKQARTLLGELRSARFDVVFDLQGLLRSALMTFATGAPLRVGLQTAREGAHLVTHYTLPDTGRQMPAHARYWRVAEALGTGEMPRQALVSVPSIAAARVAGWLGQLPRPIFGVQWGARWESKRWPASGLADVLARATQTWGGSVVIVGGGSERPAAETIRARVAETSGSPVLDLTGRTTLKELAALVNSVDAFVANDSGPLHLAAELGTPVLGIFTCTSAIRSGPPGLQHEFVSTTLPCAASYHKVCPHQGDEHLACHRLLTAEHIFAGLRRLIMKNQLDSRALRAA